MRQVPELLSPAGSLDAVRAALANGADAVYLGAQRYNARDEGAQLSLDEVGEACRLAHERGRRIYLTLNILLKPHELRDALAFLGEAIDVGIDAVIVQDIGLVRLIRAIYPELEIHGSTQMTVHDAAGARVIRDLGVERVVLARENSLEDIRAIHAEAPGIGLETFVHGALCISYSGQCYMSGMISERSANRGSCAQSCRKDYVLRDLADGSELDRGYLISAKDLAAYDHLADIAEAGVGCLKVEGRKKKPEYVATVTHGYRAFLDRIARGERPDIQPAEIQPLVQIFSRGFTGGMYGGREGREYITRTQPDNRGLDLGVVVGRQGMELLIEVREAVQMGDGLGFEPPPGSTADSRGFAVSQVRTLGEFNGLTRQAVRAPMFIADGWRVVRTSELALLERARASYADLPTTIRARKAALDARVFGSAGGPLKLIANVGDDRVTIRGEIALAPAEKRALDAAKLREQLGRLGDTPFALAALDTSGLADGLFVPVSELNHLRQRAVEELLVLRDWSEQARLADREAGIDQALRLDPVAPAALPAAAVTAVTATGRGTAVLSAEVFSLDDARTAAAAGATEIVFDPFLRHPMPPLARVRALADDLTALGVVLRIRTPTIVRPVERRTIQKWLDLGLPIVSGHLGLVHELAAAGRDVVADYAVNCFNQHTAQQLFGLGARRVTLSIELTMDEVRDVVAPWEGSGFDAIVYGRPEGMTIEHCVLSAAFDRVPTTCRDLCVQKHVNVELTDPSGYTFPVATDSACRNRLLHSRPIEGSEFIPPLWAAGVRSFRLLFNVPGDPIAALVTAYRGMLDALGTGSAPDVRPPRALVGSAFTRGHFTRAV